ncbi:MAG: hypothetical protein JW910_08885, partial [Anaerolineae bacterium]|nr:hypothetical protein [Anaerolineae bacterium]
YWALAIGVLFFGGAVGLVYQIGRQNPLLNVPLLKHDYALVLALAFAVSGPFVWAALSGMETSLFLFTMLLAFHALQRDQLHLTVLAATAMVLTRPEGLFLAGVAVLALAIRVRWPATWRDRAIHAAWMALPLAAALIQPAINILATGSASSSGMQAKSLLYNTGAPMPDRWVKILEFFGRMWSELLRGRSPEMGTYTSPLLAVLALAGLLAGLWAAWRIRHLNVAVIVLAWIVGLTAVVATLDTAFWQFKRYQLPVMALFFPAAAWTCAALGDLIERRRIPGWTRWIMPALVLIPSIFTTATFARNYADNVTVVRNQQVPMARWVRDHLPQDARIGVHDVGLVRYFGDRALYDVVGLTTPGPAASWRQGPGAIYEHMAASDYRPGYFAIYPDVQGLRYLLNAGVFGEVLAEFPVDLPRHNVASATAYQAVYAADWSATRPQELAAQTTTLAYVQGLTLVDEIDVADLESEAAHNYHWTFGVTPPGFVTEVYRHPYHACGLSEDDCWSTDGGRVITGEESFSLRTRPGEDLLLVTRVHGRTSVPLTVTVNDRWQQHRVQPAVPGRWIEVVTWVPGDLITGQRTRVRIESEIGDPAADAYMPYYHWAYQGSYAPQTADMGDPAAVFGETGAVRLLDYALEQQPGQIEVSLTWLGDAPGAGDGIVFVHLYGDIHAEPVAQVVARPMGGVLPPGNWLPGTLHDSYTVILPDDLPAGTYAVAIGLFDARTGERYPVSGEGADADRRLFIGEITLKESAP